MAVIPGNSPEIRSAAATVAVRTRDHDPADPRLLEARRRLAELQLEAHIKKCVDQAPPLTDEQRARLAELLSPVRTGGAS